MKSNSEIFWSGVVVRKNDRFVLTHNRNTFDTNYHLIDNVSKVEYLIDIDDVANDYDDLEKYECSLTFEQMLEIDLIDLIEFSWNIA